MGARDLLDDLARVGLTVTADGDRLIARPASKLTDDLRAALRASKPELLAILAPDLRRPGEDRPNGELLAAIKRPDEKFRGAIKRKPEEQFLRSIKEGREEPPQRPHALTDAEADHAHAEPWDEAACGRFVALVSLFMRRGIDAADADDLAERLHLRNVNGDDRVTCIECRHHRPGAAEDCGNSSKAGARVRGPHAATLLQRCPGFAPAIEGEDRP